MVMRQNVTAGKTPVGTEVQAKLVVGTMGEGTVFLKNAVFSRKVVESVAKTSTETSRLAIQMDSVQWKDGSAAVKIYLTGWIHPTTVASGLEKMTPTFLPRTSCFQQNRFSLALYGVQDTSSRLPFWRIC